MTTSILKPEAEAVGLEPAVVSTPPSGGVYRISHTLASRFAFLLLCSAIVLSALAYGTVHYWTLALFGLGAVTVLGLWIADGWRLGVLRISRNPLQLPLLAAIFLGFLQLLPARTPEAGPLLSEPAIRSLSFDPYATRLVLVQLVALTIYFAAALVFTDTPRRLRLLVRTIIVFGFFLAIFGLTQSFTSPNRVYWVRELAQSTAFGPFINRHHFAGYMELTIALPLGLLFAGSIQKEKRFVYLFVALLMGIALITTNSRGGIISLIAEILFLTGVTAFRRRRGHRHRDNARPRLLAGAAVRAGLALALILALFAGVVLTGGEDALTRFVGTVNSDDPTTGRAHFWNVTLEIIKTHPVLGTGLGAFGVVYTRFDTRNGLYRLEQAHNDYLQVLSDGGIVGALIALAFLALLFRIGFARRESNDEFRRGVAIGGLAGCFAVLVHSFFDFTLHTTSNALLFLILAALATLDGRVEEGGARRRHRRRRSTAPVAQGMAPADIPGTGTLV
ncbi:MAG TPA: O-antigen ligase family protein [Pyrinomonadaceae bacterium]|nr:O-antigen ligase family protein [Pyrinomonadaceae bacterium]